LILPFSEPSFLSLAIHFSGPQVWSCSPQRLALLQNAPMTPTHPLRHESTAVMAANIGRELWELRAALSNSRGDLVAEPRITAAALAHLLLCSRELLQNLLIDTARRPRRIER
ncbi:MAG: hypothetical protein RLZZ206_3625, partial [Cyanobacteriota bacterium]